VNDIIIEAANARYQGAALASAQNAAAFVQRSLPGSADERQRDCTEVPEAECPPIKKYRSYSRTAAIVSVTARPTADVRR
jgi:hypothetical protein